MLFHAKIKCLDHDGRLYFKDTGKAQVNSHKFPGVCFRSDLGWTDHVNSVRIRISGSIGAIQRFNFLLPFQVKEQLYFFLVRPHIACSHLMWGTCNENDSNRLFALQKRALSVLSENPFTGNMFNSYNALPFFLCYRHYLALLVHQKIK